VWPCFFVSFSFDLFVLFCFVLFCLSARVSSLFCTCTIHTLPNDETPRNSRPKPSRIASLETDIAQAAQAADDVARRQNANTVEERSLFEKRHTDKFSARLAAEREHLALEEAGVEGRGLSDLLQK
jgi:hypothetical protein